MKQSTVSHDNRLAIEGYKLEHSVVRRAKLRSLEAFLVDYEGVIAAQITGQVVHAG